MHEVNIFGVDFKIPEEAEYIVVDSSGEVKYFMETPTFLSSYGSWSVIKGGAQVDIGEALGYFDFDKTFIDVTEPLMVKRPNGDYFYGGKYVKPQLSSVG